MKRDEILAMQPGRELDALVAEKIFGISVRFEYSPNGPIYLNAQEKGRGHIRDYSTDISAAWGVVEKMDSNKWDMKLIKSGQYCEVSFGTKTVVRTTVPVAICKAALLAVMDA